MPSITGWKKAELVAPSVWSFTEISVPLTIATRPAPDHANLAAFGSLVSTRPIQRRPPGPVPPPPPAPLPAPEDTLPVLAAIPPVPREVLEPELPPLPEVPPSALLDPHALATSERRAAGSAIERVLCMEASAFERPILAGFRAHQSIFPPHRFMTSCDAARGGREGSPARHGES